MAKFSPRFERTEGPKPAQGRRKWRVILYNNNFHRLENVLQWLQEATGCSEDLAVEVCGVCQEDGRAVCYQGSRAKCHDIAATLRLHGLQVEVDDFF
jgi:hypothetical protein